LDNKGKCASKTQSSCEKAAKEIQVSPRQATKSHRHSPRTSKTPMRRLGRKSANPVTDRRNHNPISKEDIEYSMGLIKQAFYNVIESENGL